MKLSGIFVYPIKSLGGLSLDSSIITDRGLLHDRRWMLVDEDGLFLSQRTFPQMAVLQVSLHKDGLRVNHKLKPFPTLDLPFPEKRDYPDSMLKEVQVWDDKLQAILIDEEADLWFSRALERQVHLVYMPDNSQRPADVDFGRGARLNSLSDGMPFLMIGEASLADLNRRLPHPVPMDRFRPNFVFSGGEAFVEDRFGQIKIGNHRFFGLKPCGRCSLTTVEQSTGRPEANGEPLRTLSSFRRKGNKVLFGMNLLHEGPHAKIDLGQEIEIVQKNSPLFS